MIVSIDGEKVFHTGQHPFMIKSLSEVGVQEQYLNKAIYGKPTANIILIGRNKKISHYIRYKARVSTFTTSTQLVLEVLATAIRQEKEIKVIKIRKEEVKSLSADDMIIT